MKKWISIFFVLLLFVVNCKNKPKENITLYGATSENLFSESLIVDNIDENTVLKFSDIFDSISFIRLETNETALIGSVEKIIAVNDKFIILDGIIAKKVLVFHEDGRFLNQIGSKGAGPEEYDAPNDITYDKYNDELLIYVNNHKKIMRFKLDGTFIGNIKLDFWTSVVFVIDENKYGLYVNYHNNSQYKGYNLIVIDRDGKVLNLLMPFDIDSKNISGVDINAFTNYQDKILFSPYYDNKIYEFSIDSIIPKYYWNFDNHIIPEELYNNVTSKELRKMIDDNGEYMYCSISSEISSHVIGKVIYKRKIFDCYYSKESKKYNAAAVFINDMFGLVSSSSFMCTKGDLLISTVSPEQFVTMQELIQGMKNEKKDIKKIWLSQLNSPTAAIFKPSLKKNLKHAIESVNFTLADDEIDFINSIDETDNPIIRVARLKK